MRTVTLNCYILPATVNIAQMPKNLCLPTRNRHLVILTYHLTHSNERSVELQLSYDTLHLNNLLKHVRPQNRLMKRKQHVTATMAAQWQSYTTVELITKLSI